MAWFDDQNGKGAGTCRAKDVAQLLVNVQRHEGITLSTDSHLGIANQQMAAKDPQQLIEPLYAQPAPPGQFGSDPTYHVYQKLFTFFNDSSSSYQKAQKAYDVVDTPKVPK